MRLLAIAAIATLAAASSVQASDQMSDADYTRLARCVGLAVGSDQDGAALQAALRENSDGRRDIVLARAQAERLSAQQAFRSAKGSARDRLTAEWTDKCSAFAA